MRFVPLVLLGIATLYGLVRFRPSKWHSPRYVSNPKDEWWSPWRFFDSSEWTTAGLAYRREIVICFFVCCALALAYSCFE